MYMLAIGQNRGTKKQVPSGATFEFLVAQLRERATSPEYRLTIETWLNYERVDYNVNGKRHWANGGRCELAQDIRFDEMITGLC